MSTTCAPNLPAVFDEVQQGDRVSLQQAARENGQHPATWFRWRVWGPLLADGRRLTLGTVRLGHRVFTSRAEIRRFFEALNSNPAGTNDTPAPRSPSERGRAHDAADRELRDSGL